MSRKTKLAIIITVSSVLLVALWIVGYSALKANNDRLRDEGIMATILEHFERENEFSHKYGKVASVARAENEKITIIDKYHCKVPCVITMENGDKYSAVINCAFISSQKTEFEFESVNKLS